MDLPHGQGGKTGHEQDRSEVEADQRRDFLCGQGLCNASCGDIGIMFWSMWYMTHIEPTNVTTTSVRVNTRAMKVHPPSDFVFMCRK
jgi:hypothetical protein